MSAAGTGRLRVLVVCVAVALLAAGGQTACNLDVAVPSGSVDLDIVADGAADGRGDEVLAVEGKGVGEACAVDGECRSGLGCEAASCQPAGTTAAGAPCLISPECGAGLYCSFTGLCAQAGAGAEGAPCASGADCQADHVCVLAGFQGTCAPGGERDVGQPCQGLADCYGGLRCAGDGTCAAGSALFGAPFFAGVACADDGAVEGPSRFFFEVPRGGTVVEDFYRLPFPNDVRRVQGRLDLSGHPVPGQGLLGVDLVARLIEALEADLGGWGTNPTIFFRASAWIDTKTVVATGDAKTVRMVNLTEGSPAYGKDLELGWFATTERDKYVCRNTLRLHRPWSRPLAPGATYAVVITTGVTTAPAKDEQGRVQPGKPLTPDADFAAMLTAGAPDDADLARAWGAYAPLRAWIATGAVEADELVAGTVFTTDRVRDPLPRLRKAVDARPASPFADWTLCGAGIASPCDDGLTGDAHVRGCFAESDAFYEVHARVTLPVFQRGTRPYLEPTDGGDVRFQDDTAEVVGEEAVCVALTVPKGVDMPASGWPVALYAHGTGGTFRSHVSEGLAASISRVEESGEALGVAVLGYDQVMHGDRRHSELSPDTLVYNFANPRAARGNLLQAAADNLALARALPGVVVPAEASPTGAEIRFDPARVTFIGHSQGGTSGPLAMPWAREVSLAVYSGAGGSLVLSLLGKSSPVPILAGVKLALQDPAVGATHPVLSLAQMYFDAVDPLNYAALQFAFPEEGTTGRHVLHTYGLDDTYTPPECIKALAGAMYVTLAQPVLDDIGGVAKAPPPITGNWAGTTAVTVEYAPDGYDGHFVLFRSDDARRQLRAFLASALRDGTPTLVP